jgi:ABC-type transport system involved in multi-copper enzyme maturation permease subunit
MSELPKPPDPGPSSLDDIFLRNPLYVEFKRGWRRFIGVGGTNFLNVGVLALGAVIYLTIVSTVLGNLQFMNAVFVVIAYLGIVVFVVPAVGHAAIAGEREKRTWEVLLCSPLTNLQVAFGKYMTSLLSSLVIFLLFVPLVFASLFSQESRLGEAILATVCALCFTVFAQTVTLVVSSLCKRAYAAQIATYMVLFLGLAIWPALVGIASAGDETTTRLLNCLNPFLALGMIRDHSWMAWASIPIYLVLSAVGVLFVSSTLRVGDGDPVRRSSFGGGKPQSAPESVPQETNQDA